MKVNMEKMQFLLKKERNWSLTKHSVKSRKQSPRWSDLVWGVNCTTLPRRSYSFEIATIFWMSQLLFTSLLEVLQLLIKIKSSAVVFLNRKLQFILLQSTSLKLASIKDIMHETLVITIDDITRYVSAVLAFQKAVISHLKNWLNVHPFNTLLNDRMDVNLNKKGFISSSN